MPSSIDLPRSPRENLAPSPATSRVPQWPGMVAIVALAVLAYAGGWRNGFVWDDDAHLTPPALRSLAGLGRIWSEPGATQQYYPLLHSAFWLEHRLWGDAALGYHLVNVALHALAACLFARLLLRLAVPGAWFAALVFALHPLQVESVAWISEQKNTFSLVFYLGATLAWWRFDAHRTRGAYYGALLLFVCALLTKSVTATLPAALLVVTWWRRGRIAWREDVRPLIPWIAAALAAGIFTALLERKLIGAEGTAFELDPFARLLLAGRVVWFYLGKFAWPGHLMFIYPRWIVSAAQPLAWLPLAAALALTMALVRRARRGGRGLLAAWLLFVGALFPALGFFNVFPFLYSFVADHFQYLASLATCAVAGAALARLGTAHRVTGLCVAGGVLLALGLLTAEQTRLYRDNATLMRATLERNPACWMAANNLGKELINDAARRPEAIALFERALALRPAYLEAHNNLGLAFTQDGRLADAIPHLQTALQLQPSAYQAHNNLGIALARSGRADEALRSFRQAAALAPTMPNIQENWAKALLLLDRRAEAEEHFALARRLRGAP